MTTEELRKKLDDRFSVCPFCESVDLKASIGDGERIVSFNVTCDTCGGSWVEFYKFTEATEFVPGTKLNPKIGGNGDGI